MVEALFYGTGRLQVQVHVDAWLMHGSGYWYKLFGAS
jgi:hypothetical protein